MNDSSRFQENQRPPQSKVRYPYHDADGQLLFERILIESHHGIFRGFKWLDYRRPGSLENFDPTAAEDAVPYRLPELQQARKDGRPICLVYENFVAGMAVEQIVERLRKWGFAATCGAAGLWLLQYNVHLESSDVVLVGRSHVGAESLAPPLTRRLRVLKVPVEAVSREAFGHLFEAAADYLPQADNGPPPGAVKPANDLSEPPPAADNVLFAAAAVSASAAGAQEASPSPFFDPAGYERARMWADAAEAKTAAHARSLTAPETFGLKLGPPRIITKNMKYGPRMVRSAEPTEAFKEAWQTNNYVMKRAGYNYSLNKRTGKMEVAFWQDPPEKRLAPVVTVIAKTGVIADAALVTAPAEGFEITLFTKQGGPLTKVISLAPDGTLNKDGSACRMARGTAERVRIANVHEFAALLEALTPEQTPALGRLRPVCRTRSRSRPNQN
jgi:hypothetical protein